MRITNEFLIKTSFTVALIGMLLLTIMSKNIKYNNARSYASINNNMKVSVRGKITDIKIKGSTGTLSIKFNTTLKAVGKSLKTKNLRINDIVEVEGTVSRGVLFVSKIRKVN